MPIKKNRNEVRVKRENWNHHYRVVARKNGRLVTNRAWHTAHDRQVVVDRVFTFEEGSRYSYLIGSYDYYGNPQSLAIKSSRAVSLGDKDSYERQRLFEQTKNKYVRKDEKYKELHGFFIISRTDLDTREKKMYHTGIWSMP